eukprot:3179-Chlamydomonas_euryale.AAC.2
MSMCAAVPAFFNVCAHVLWPPPSLTSAHVLLPAVALPALKWLAHAQPGTLPHLLPATTEKDLLAETVRGDVIKSLLPVIDNFELARTNVKVWECGASVASDGIGVGLRRGEGVGLQ